MSQAAKSLHLRNALTPTGWRENVRLTFSAGLITAVEIGAAGQPHDERHAIGLPGVGNLHSHAFQRAMAGLAERRGATSDSFWTWRETMYRFALMMTPDQVEAIAAQAYVEMLECGFTRVGEFHYLHHAPDGRPYADVAEMAVRIAAATSETGLGLTLLPVFYAHSGFGGLPPGDAQRRFICDLDLFASLSEGCRAATRACDGAIVGLAPHSLRAVTPDELVALVGAARSGPIHIHIAEQFAEVEASIAWSGARPLQWLLDHAEVGPRWCLIHATHIDDSERRRLAASGAVAGLCPITEANLGDGVFPAAEFMRDGGRFGVGSDSNVEIDLAGELRLLEYGQRLTRRLRNVLAEPGGSNGDYLHAEALRGGATALGRDVAGLAVGADADIVTLTGDFACEARHCLDGLIFARNPKVDCVYARGRLMVVNGEHVARKRIRARFSAAMAELMTR